ncbi:hypothetical protein CFP56_033894, partial [Quercus suber]
IEINQCHYQFSDVDEFMELACDDRVIRTSRLRYYTSGKDALDYLRKFQCLTHATEPYVWRTIQLDSCVKPGSDYEIVEGKSAMLLDQSIGTKVYNHSGSEFEFPDMERLEGFVNVDIKASQRVLEKAGFQRECLLRCNSFAPVLVAQSIAKFTSALIIGAEV